MPIRRFSNVLFIAASLFAQRDRGELRLLVVDSSGLPLESAVHVDSASTQTSVGGQSGRDGRYIVKPLAFGIYHLRVERTGFARHAELVEIRSELPVERRVTLMIAPLSATVTVGESATLVDPHRTGTAYHVGAEALAERRATAPGRELLDMVQAQPGWVLEANGILHPRGSEYQTQYVLDGFPIQDNQSPGFAPAIEVEDTASVQALTGNYPAEYGRKLGGIVELQTMRTGAQGTGGRLVLQQGSFGTQHGYAYAQAGAGRAAQLLVTAYAGLLS